MEWHVLGIQHTPESYDSNSGYSYDIKLFYMTRDGRIIDLVVDLCKPAIYSKWNCVWKEYEKYKDEMILNHAQGVFVFNTKDLATGKLNLSILPMEQFYPHFIDKPPHCFNSKDMVHIMNSINESVTPLPVGIAHLLYEKIIRDYLPFVQLGIDYMKEKQIELDVGYYEASPFPPPPAACFTRGGLGGFFT